MHMHPESYIEMVDQDRERAMARRALERAAREGGDQHPGQARGGIVGLAGLVRSLTTAVGHPRSRSASSGSSRALPSGA